MAHISPGTSFPLLPDADTVTSFTFASVAALLVDNQRLQDEVLNLRALLAAIGRALPGQAEDAPVMPARDVGPAIALSARTSLSGQPCSSPDSAQQAAAAPHLEPSTEEVPSAPGSSADRSCRTDGAPPPLHGLSKLHVERYSRHLLLPSFGLEAQRRVCSGSVLIVGCGGLGAPAALYLAAAGVGRVGLVDRDHVELSNLHRQVIHTEARVGVHKALSAAASCSALNSLVCVEPHLEGLTPANALALVSAYDVVLDASDNPATRYLISDACVVAGRPLVSAAAVGTDGQLTVYCHDTGPCYRCLFPESPAPGNCSRCSDAGVLGPVPGVMGTLQALEVLKVLGQAGRTLAGRLVIFDGLEGRFTTVKLRGRSPACVACGAAPTITAASLAAYDYAAFTGQAADDKPPPPLTVLRDAERLSPAQLQERLLAATAHSALDAAVPQPPPPPPPPLLLVDVRPAAQFCIMALPGALHHPFDDFAGSLPALLSMCGLPPPAAAAAAADGAASPGNGAAPAQTAGPSPAVDDGGSCVPSAGCVPPAGLVPHAGCVPPAGCPAVVVVCRRGNHSQLAVQELRRHGVTWATDLRGGYTAWAQEQDLDMPIL